MGGGDADHQAAADVMSPSAPAKSTSPKRRPLTRSARRRPTDSAPPPGRWSRVKGPVVSAVCAGCGVGPTPPARRRQTEGSRREPPHGPSRRGPGRAHHVSTLLRRWIALRMVESDQGAADEVMRRLQDAGHEIEGCFGSGMRAFPRKALATPGRCPLDTAEVDAVLVRRRPWPRPTPREQGVTCALRAGVPLVVRALSP